MMRQLLVFVLIMGWLSPSVWAADQAPLKIITETWAPFSYEENGEVKGAITDIVRATFQEMNIPVTFHVVPWKRAITMLKQGKGDALYSASYNAERAKFLIYPQHPIYQVKYLFYFKKGSGFTFDGNMNHLRGKIGAMRGYSYNKAFWTTPQSCKNCYIIEPVNALKQNFEKLYKGNLTAFPASQTVAEAMIKKEGYDGMFEASPIPLVTKDYFLTFRQGVDPTLVKKFDQVIVHMQATTGSILTKHKHL